MLCYVIGIKLDFIFLLNSQILDLELASSLGSRLKQSEVGVTWSRANWRANFLQILAPNQGSPFDEDVGRLKLWAWTCVRPRASSNVPLVRKPWAFEWSPISDQYYRSKRWWWWFNWMLLLLSVQLLRKGRRNSDDFTGTNIRTIHLNSSWIDGNFNTRRFVGYNRRLGAPCWALQLHWEPSNHNLRVVKCQLND